MEIQVMKTIVMILALLGGFHGQAQADDTECKMKVIQALPKYWPGAIVTSRLIPVSSRRALADVPELHALRWEVEAVIEKGSLNFEVRAKIPREGEMREETLLVLTRDCREVYLYPVSQEPGYWSSVRRSILKRFAPSNNGY
jgi:hypothetical protein